MTEVVDVLMISHNRPKYLEKTLPKLLDSADDHTRIWLWQNGSHEETLSVWERFLNDPRVYQHHHSPENKVLREPTHWLWENAAGELVGKVDDDCIVDPTWIGKFRQAHHDVQELGIVASWHFQPEDFNFELSKNRIKQYQNGHSILQGCWVGGSGYLAKKTAIFRGGLIDPNKSFTHLCYRIAALGYVNGWYYPLVYQDHLDDPRSPNYPYQSDEEFEQSAPLSALNFKRSSIREFEEQIKSNALLVQTAPLNPKYYESRFWRAVRRAGQNLRLMS